MAKADNIPASIDRVLRKLDEYFYKKDYTSAEQHLLYWLDQAEKNGDARMGLAVSNELMGLYRKIGKEQPALKAVDSALEKIEQMGIGDKVGAATTFLNCATVYKAFGKAQAAIPLFEKTKAIYERELEPQDDRLAGLYNNMALALVDVKHFAEANSLYEKAIEIMRTAPNGALEVAITYLNMASAAEAEEGLVEADEKITEYLKKAEALLESHPLRDGYYAFVCEKCASVYGYYGHFFYEKELMERARRFYEGS